MSTPPPPRPTGTRWPLLWRYARGRLPRLVLALALGLAVSASGLVSPLATKGIIDNLGAGRSLAGPVALLVALLVVGAVVSWWQWSLLGELAEDVVLDAREGMLRRFLGARVVPLLQRPTGEMVTRVTSDSVLLREAASSSIIGLLNGAVMLVGTVVLMAVLDVPLVLVTVLAIGIVVVLFATLMPAIGRAQERSQAALGSLGGSLEASLRAIRTVKAAGAEDRQLDLLLTGAAESRDQSVVAVRREALVWTVSWAGVQAAIVVVLGFGAWRVADGQLTVSTLIAFLLYAFGLINPVMELSQNLTTLQSGLAAAARIEQVQALEPEPTAGTGAAPGAAPGEEPARTAAEDAVLEFRGVTARYAPGVAPAVRDLDLTIARRGHTAVVGPSGAGKTTVFSLLLRFLEPESGSLLLDGRPYAELTPRQVRRHLAYVEQETPVLPGTIRDNLLFANPDATPADVEEVLRQIRLDTFVASLPAGLDTPLSEASVSGGQRQRIALARALLAQPQVLLLDEATAQVDGLTEQAIHETVRRYAEHRAVVTIAHRLSTVLDADTIVVMDGAAVVARGTHAHLLSTSPLYRSLVEALRIPEPAGKA
ncbi:ABC transporter ATP-binding protein [Kineococcus sp. SYSU DK002]|uniref:ABC transporter ATP-binding protein n=1 Tax=Kineococcus sp. SYSU DK002 TaxID=3383123 RepID=UPI003D7C9064